jgi:hypothetical protein
MNRRKRRSPRCQRTRPTVPWWEFGPDLGREDRRELGREDRRELGREGRRELGREGRRELSDA